MTCSREERHCTATLNILCFLHPCTMGSLCSKQSHYTGGHQVLGSRSPNDESARKSTANGANRARMPMDTAHRPQPAKGTKSATGDEDRERRLKAAEERQKAVSPLSSLCVALV